ncbi:DUF4150 domain-containing protein [Sorangium sp. So ce131]|uniref:DUF4150 domain-containing protein n=1 Tax=Sorangium sp. So ce131 TaxID=3133282 RepID=UPI003F609290
MSVFANNRSIIHKGDSGVHTAAPPDVCKTPSPGGPVPIPYVNIALSGDLAKGTKKVKIAGNPTANAGSNLSTSSGDEAGTAGGVISSKFKGKLTWASTSTDVKTEGKGVARFMDPTQQNGNTGNTAFLSTGQMSVFYADDFEGACSICGQDPPAHRVPETATSKNNIKQLRDKLLARIQPKMQALTECYAREMDYNLIYTRLGDLKKAQKRLPVDAPAQESKSIQDEIDKLKIELKAAEKTWKTSKATADNDTLKRVTNGYMIGCIVCRTHAEPFGAMSGKESTAGFLAALNELGWTPCETSVSKEEFPTMNPRIQESEAKVASFQKAWKECETNGEGEEGARRRQQGESWNKPGECAAAKLIGRAAPHRPQMMTEEWFDPVRLKSVSLTYPHIDNSLRGLWRRTIDFLYGNIQFRRVPGTFQDASTVPSCNTCQTMIPFLSCDNQKACG